MIYLQAPIVNDQFVRRWLQHKLLKLNKIVSLLFIMPHKHEAATFHCRLPYAHAASYPDIRLHHAIRREFTQRVQLLGIGINDLKLEIAKLPLSYVAIGWKTGSHTYHAYYIASTIKTSAHVTTISPTHTTLTIAQPTASEWLQNIGPSNVTIKMMLHTIRYQDHNQGNLDLSKINFSTAR